MAEQLFLGIDVGASSLTAVAVDGEGRVRGRASSPYETASPQPGWHEQRPEDWWDACRAAIAALGAQVALRDIAAIGLAGQARGAVFLDANREVIRATPVGKDERAAAEAAEIERVLGIERLACITGSRLSASSTAAKLLWLRRGAPIAYKLLHHLLLPKDYVRLQLTGELATDAGDASGTGLFDVAGRGWSAEVMDALDLDASILPAVLEGTEISGVVRISVAAELGLPARIPVVAGAGDSQARAVSAGAVRAGVAMVEIEGPATAFVATDAFVPDPNGRMAVMCHSVPGLWLIAGDGEGGQEGQYAGERSRGMMADVRPLLGELLGFARARGVPVSEVRVVASDGRPVTGPQALAEAPEVAVRTPAQDAEAAFGAALLAATSAGAFASVEDAARAWVRVV